MSPTHRLSGVTIKSSSLKSLTRLMLEEVTTMRISKADRYSWISILERAMHTMILRSLKRKMMT